MKTYPVVTPFGIRELTEEQRDALEWRSLSDAEKINLLMGRVERIEKQLSELMKHATT